MEDKIISLLEDIHPGVDFAKEQHLIDNRILDSFDVVSLATELMDEFDIQITAEHLVPENFNTTAAIAALVEKLQEE